MKPVLILLAVAVLILSCMFLAFAAVFVCDGYYPQPWTLRGVLIRFAVWLPCLCFAAGILLTLDGRRRTLGLALIYGVIVAVVCLESYFAATSDMSGAGVPLAVISVVTIAAFALQRLYPRRSSRIAN